VYRYTGINTHNQTRNTHASSRHGQNPTLGNADQTIPGDFYIPDKNSHHGMYDHHPYTQTYICISRQTDEHEPIHHECIGTLYDICTDMLIYLLIYLQMCLQISLTFSMCFFCCGLVQREVLLWNFKDYLKFQRNITEKFQKDRHFFYPWLVDALCHPNADKTWLRRRG
jgi:hypothetical protein